MNLSVLWQTIKVGCARFFFHAYIWLRIYKYWSRLYQFIWERKRTPVKGFRDLPDLVWYVRDLKWRPDTWKQLWDAISHPEHVQWLADNDPKKFIGDCDDFAIYEATVIAQQLRGDALLTGSIHRARLLTVPWYNLETQRFGGHNVCLIEAQLDHDGPNERTMYCYMDYGYPSRLRATIAEVVQDVLDIYVGNERISLGWAVSDTHLTPREQSWK